MNISQRSAAPGSPAFASLNAAAANATGEVVNYNTLRCKAAMQVILTGVPSGGTIKLQGSLDGTNFDTTAGDVLATFTIGTDNSGDIKVVVDKPFIALRAVLASLAGGTNPTVTALVAAY